MSDVSGIGSSGDPASLQAANEKRVQQNSENLRQAQREINKENSATAPRSTTDGFSEAQTAEKVRAQRAAAEQSNASIEQTTRQSGETTQAQDQNVRRLAAEAERREDPAPSGAPGNIEQFSNRQNSADATSRQTDSALGNNIDLQA